MPRIVLRFLVACWLLPPFAMKRALSLFTILAAGCSLVGCASVDPRKLYPELPSDSSFKRTVTTPWGTTEVEYRTGPETDAN